MEGPDVAVIALCNRKGGVGKSTSTFNLGGTLAKAGRRVLLVDVDPQASLSQGILGPDAVASLDPLTTIAAAYSGDISRPEQVVRPTGFPGLDLIAGSEFAGQYETGKPHEEDYDRQTCLADLMGDLRGGYDHVLLDCPPSLGLFTWAALTAADSVLVPVQCEDYGAQGLTLIFQAIEAVRLARNPRLEVLGLLLTMVAPRRAIHQLYDGLLREQYGDLVFSAAVPAAPDIPESIMLRKPVCHHKPRGAAAKSIAAVVEELESRLALPLATGQGEAA
jgi:chromosome partitioning protein